MRKVLIIEKDEFTCDMLAESLLALQYNPVICNSSATLAIQLIETDPDIVIIHRQCFIKYRYLFISKDNQEERLSKAYLILTSNALLEQKTVNESGVNYFLLKPYDLKTLSRALENAEKTLNQAIITDK